METTMSDASSGGAQPRHGRELALFFGLTFLLSWTLWGVLYLADENDLGGMIGPLGAFAPPVAAVIALLVTGQGLRRSFWAPILHWRIGWWWAVVMAVPIAILVIGWAVMVGLGEPPFPAEMPSLATLPLLVVFMTLLGGGQEEPGWRGYALPRLQAHIGALGASLVIGVIWAAWHLPLFAFSETGQAGLNLWIYFPYVMGISVMLTWVFNSTGGSVLAVMVLHGLINLIGGFIPMGVLAAAELATLIGVWVVAGAVIATYGPANLSRRGPTPAAATTPGARAPEVPA
jgi:membrane protease YdiL (CAAX protease family)